LTRIMDQLAQCEAAHQFLRQYTLPEEDRAKYTSVRWSGGYRWFRSPNVVCLEKVRLLLTRTVRKSA